MEGGGEQQRYVRVNCVNTVETQERHIRQTCGTTVPHSERELMWIPYSQHVFKMGNNHKVFRPSFCLCLFVSLCGSHGCASKLHRTEYDTDSSFN